MDEKIEKLDSRLHATLEKVRSIVLDPNNLVVYNKFLTHALENDDLEILKFLLSFGKNGDLFKRSDENQKEEKTIKNKKKEKEKEIDPFLLKHGSASLILFEACEKCAVNCVDFLINEQGVNVNQKMKDRVTPLSEVLRNIYRLDTPAPLSLASFPSFSFSSSSTNITKENRYMPPPPPQKQKDDDAKRLIIIQKLLLAGANVDSFNADLNLVAMAVRKNDPYLVKLLIDHCSPEKRGSVVNPMTDCNPKKISMVPALFLFEKPVKTMDDIYDSLECMKILYQHGADLSVKRNNGETILFFACQKIAHLHDCFGRCYTPNHHQKNQKNDQDANNLSRSSSASATFILKEEEEEEEEDQKEQKAPILQKSNSFFKNIISRTLSNKNLFLLDPSEPLGGSLEPLGSLESAKEPPQKEKEEKRDDVLACVRFLVEVAGLDVNHSIKQYGEKYSVLKYAVLSSNLTQPSGPRIKLIKYLLERGADPNQTGFRKKVTHLDSLVASTADPIIVRLLLAYGALVTDREKRILTGPMVEAHLRSLTHVSNDKKSATVSEYIRIIRGGLDNTTIELLFSFFVVLLCDQEEDLLFMGPRPKKEPFMEPVVKNKKKREVIYLDQYELLVELYHNFIFV